MALTFSISTKPYPLPIRLQSEALAFPPKLGQDPYKHSPGFLSLLVIQLDTSSEVNIDEFFVSDNQISCFGGMTLSGLDRIYDITAWWDEYIHWVNRLHTPYEESRE